MYELLATSTPSPYQFWGNRDGGSNDGGNEGRGKREITQADIDRVRRYPVDTTRDGDTARGLFVWPIGDDPFDTREPNPDSD